MSDIRRREFMILLGTAAAAWPLAAGAQQPDRVRRVGVLMGIADDFEGQARIAVFRQALQALGWSEGLNIQFIYRWSGGDVAHARQFAKELLDLRSDVILTNSTPPLSRSGISPARRRQYLCRSATRSALAWSKA